MMITLTVTFTAVPTTKGYNSLSTESYKVMWINIYIIYY